MKEHECENCGHTWKAQAEVSHCMACGWLDESEGNENGNS